MKNWYINREAGALNHCGVDIPEGKKILLSEEQASLHGEKVEKSDAPVEKNESAVAAEFAEWQAQQEMESSGEEEQGSRGVEELAPVAPLPPSPLVPQPLSPTFGKKKINNGLDL
ncbi:hypothetical protein [Pleurocapsa sp. FMAR1]|uniref:hypothetical protein n=1 Tax=Pleurocapsa sp. FMAR1 TaxID=3040204 RepID=UPI0029C900E5|nr:hypothetical protein [Pleurocapsa sp. FMAR1]